MLNAFSTLLCFKLCWHNRLKPSQDQLATDSNPRIKVTGVSKEYIHSGISARMLKLSKPKGDSVPRRVAVSTYMGFIYSISISGLLPYMVLCLSVSCVGTDLCVAEIYIYIHDH